MKINNWDEWFKNCGDVSPDLKEYEGLAGEFFNAQFPNTKEGLAQASESFQAYHKTGFYNKRKKLPGFMLASLLKSGVKFFLIGFAVLLLFFLVRTFLSAQDAGMSFTEYITANTSLQAWQYLVFSSVPGALVSFVLRVVSGIAAYSLRVNKICKKMCGLENRLKERIQFVPPKYRNSLATDSIYSLYCNYGVTTFEQAIASCDEYLRSNNFVAAYMAVMFDEPYTSVGSVSLETGGDNDEDIPHMDNMEDEPEDVSDPNLPDDIRTKRHRGVDDAYEKLNSLIGLNAVKQQIQQMKNRMDFYGESGTQKISGNHMVFLGSPGTGKTTVARIITKILYDFGYIRKNKLVEIDGGYLKSPFSGQTTERANAIIRYAMDGVLFIDEAYLLLDNSDAGPQAAGVLLKAMEDHKDRFVVIMAGYEDNINRLLSSNEGFASRIKHKIYFEDFSADEMVEIFRMQLNSYSKNNDYVIMPETLSLLKTHFEKEKRVPGFGNARVVRNSLDKILDIHADRFMNGILGPEEKYVITPEDVSEFIEGRVEQMQNDGRNFIANNNLDSNVISLSELKGKTKPGVKDPDKALSSLIGLDMVKNEIQQMKAQFSFYEGNIENEGNHMVFLGPPGTGKTTVAAIMTSYLYQMGLINENRYLDINGDFLRGMYIGHTGKRTEAVIQYAQGMVLFIDEAYLLNSSDSGSDSDSFGQEAVGVLLDAMEKYRKNFVVIFAGYEGEMERFLNMNSGLKSRISLEFHFKPYTPREMAQIFKRTASRNKFQVEKEVWPPMQKYFYARMQEPMFGNGRFVRQFFEECKKSHITNYANGKLDESKKYIMTPDDIIPVIERKRDANQL